MKVKVTVGFFSPPADDTSIFNKIASCWSTPTSNNRMYSHVELRFSDGAVTSITQSPGIVHYDTSRMLSNSGYQCFYEIEIDLEIEKAMQAYAKMCAEKKIPFNRIAVYWNFVPILSCMPIKANGDAYFCSEYITTLLQKAGFCADLDPATTSPNDVYMSLRNDPYADATFNKTLYKARGNKLLID